MMSNDCHDVEKIQKIENFKKIALDIMRHNRNNVAKIEVSVDVSRNRVTGKIITTEQKYDGGALYTVVREEPF